MPELPVVYYVMGRQRSGGRQVIQGGPFRTKEDAQRWARDQKLGSVHVSRVKR